MGLFQFRVCLNLLWINFCEEDELQKLLHHNFQYVETNKTKSDFCKIFNKIEREFTVMILD